MKKPMTGMDCLRENIKRLRLGQEMTQERVAMHTNLSYKYYQSLEAGRIDNPTYLSIERLARLFKVEYWQLFHPTLFPEPAIKRLKPRRILH
jgi:transcriptional regulator with XRE-family HTH domain